MADFDDDLRLAHVLADAADDISLRRFRSLDLHVDTKPDLTPVSDADRAVEEALRSVLSRARPRDAILGEEYGHTGHSRRCWVVDPIDGTKNYVRGVPVWATLIALLEGETPVVGLVSAPALTRRWWASRGGGTWSGRSLTKASRCTVSGVERLSDASLSFSSLHGWEEQDRLGSFLSLTRDVWRTRAYGDFWSHVMVAEGTVDIAAEPELSLWDAAPVPLLLEEAGGRATGLDGQSFTDGGALVCTNGTLHDSVLTQLNGGPTPRRFAVDGT
ncbi:histidinol-phosphatase [Lipingzhangella sp. LS1_29]|uniref:Histidinol-phosphatase n=1 Tax=Lipingzhangella rawalii TaxID=2055835 RepID=A0ABU2HB46_9ACTN|nr:histidinol-phosphatase [Lipingzhangella rawalii]MDS1272543.1 histidinol-phosphatase [Lipingzhangella rawalii]